MTYCLLSVNFWWEKHTDRWWIVDYLLWGNTWYVTDTRSPIFGGQFVDQYMASGQMFFSLLDTTIIHFW